MKPWLLCLSIALVTVGCDTDSPVLLDFDGDGSLDADDCGSADPLIYPGADDPYGDDVDQDCDGGDGIDIDGDGYPGNEELAARFAQAFVAAAPQADSQKNVWEKSKQQASSHENVGKLRKSQKKKS